MNIKLSIVITFLSVLIAGCSPYYPFFPEYLDANVNNGTYTAPVGRGGPGIFSMVIPQAIYKFEVTFLEKREIFAPRYTYVSFGPIASDDTRYRVLVADKGNLPMSVFKCRYWPIMVALGAKGYDLQMDELYSSPIFVKGFPALYEVYTQVRPGFYQYISRYQPGDVTLTHAVYTIDYGRYGAIVWVQAASDSGINSIDDQNRYQVITRKWRPLVRLMRSFVVYGERKRPRSCLFCSPITKQMQTHHT